MLKNLPNNSFHLTTYKVGTACFWGQLSFLFLLSRIAQLSNKYCGDLGASIIQLEVQ